MRVEREKAIALLCEMHGHETHPQIDFYSVAPLILDLVGEENRRWVNVKYAVYTPGNDFERERVFTSNQRQAADDFARLMNHSRKMADVWRE